LSDGIARRKAAFKAPKTERARAVTLPAFTLARRFVVLK
jgi:hypothetical protein